MCDVERGGRASKPVKYDVMYYPEEETDRYLLRTKVTLSDFYLYAALHTSSYRSSTDL